MTDGDYVPRTSENPPITRDINDEAVQLALLKILEVTAANVPPKEALQHFMWVRSSMTNIVGETSNQIGPIPVAEKPLAGRTALVVGVANKDSIAHGVARALRRFGADVAMTYLNDKTRSYTEELATALEVRPELFLECDLSSSHTLSVS